MITLDDVKQVCSKNINCNIFDISDYIISGKKSLALDILDRAYSSDPYSLIKFISLWYRYFENLFWRIF